MQLHASYLRLAAKARSRLDKGKPDTDCPDIGPN